MSVALYIILAAITLASITLLKTYTHIPRKELKRRARRGDDLAALLYSAAAYGGNLQILLWVIIGLGATGFFLVLDHSVSNGLAMIGSLALLWLGFAWLPYTRVSKIGLVLARMAAKPLAWVLQRLYPILNRFVDLTKRWRVTFHTGLYEKEDLLDLLENQTTQTDNRLTEQEIQTAKNALTFGDKIVRDIMTMPGSVVAVSADDTIGPILMTELHDSGFSRFPVYESKKSNRVTGTLYLHDLVNIKSGGKVGDLMSKKVYYLHDEESLDQALQAFLASKHHLFMVVNSFEDIVGVVTIEDILEQLIGRPIEGEFDQHSNKHDVAKRLHSKIEEDKSPIENKDEMVESEQL